MQKDDVIYRQAAIDACTDRFGICVEKEALEALPSAHPETAKRIIGKSRDGMTIIIGDDGKARAYDDTYDITIHCESKEEQDEVKRRFMSEPTCSPANIREKVFEIIDKVRAMYPYRIAGRSDTYDSYNEAWRDCADQIEVQIEAYLKDVSEKNVGEWISCGKRMPEEHEWIGTKTFGTTISDEVYVTFESLKGERFTKHLSFQNGKVPSFEQREIDAWYKGSVPIAWKPLPDPYRGGEKE